MILEVKNLFDWLANKKTTILLLSVVFFFVGSFTIEVSAQRKFSKTYPASKNVRLELANRTGTVTVEGWEKPEVYVKDNQGRTEVGNVNFLIKVPYSSSVDIQTAMGNLSVSNVQGMLVRAKISTEGDITLTNIGANNVSAENLIGDIFFDGVIHSDGIYRFSSMRGNINLRIPSNSSFQLVATAPSTRNIQLGSFSNSGLSFVSDGRRVIGKTGDGGASLTVTNQKGSIAFIRR